MAEVTMQAAQGATLTRGFVYCEPTYDVDGNLVVDVNGDPVPGDPISLAGCMMRLQVRDKKAGTTLYLTATSEDSDEHPDRGGRILLESGGETGRVDIVLTDLDTMKVLKTKAYYDLELVWPQESHELRPHVDRIMQGPYVNDLNTTLELA